MTDHRDINDIQRDIDSARRNLNALGVELKSARDDAAEFKVGDEVQAFLSGAWVEAIVAEVDHVGVRTWYKVATRTRSGGWSKSSRRAFDRVRQPAP